MYGNRILSNIFEIALDKPQLLRIAGYRLHEARQWATGAWAFKKVLKLRPDEPQSWRDYGLLLADSVLEAREEGSKEALSEGELASLQKSVDLLTEVVLGGRWRTDFDEIEQTALAELNRVMFYVKQTFDVTLKCDTLVDFEKQHLLPVISSISRRHRMSQGNISPADGLKPASFPEKKYEISNFLRNLDMDLRISLGWDTDMVDIDLWVFEPTGEKIYYSHPMSKMGRA